MQTGAEDQQVTTGAESMEEEFMWEEFLEETGATAAPHTIFRHVEVSLQSSFQPGMKLEVASKSSPESYWVATIITTCGQLLLLRYSGYGDDRKADFWCDVMTAELHPVGWCAQNHKTLTPPEAIREKYSDWTEFLVQDLTGSRTAPANLLEGPLRGKNTMDLIVADSVLELQNLSDPLLYWPVRVVQNVGGRLRLRPVGLSERHRAQDTWLFYLDVRLRPLGWALENRLTLEPPAELRPLLSDLDWQQALRDAAGQKDALALEVFKDQADLPRHAFRTGMKLEMVSPWEQLLIRPVSVTKVYSDTHFQVTLDDLRADATPRSAVCHANSPGILPVQWCLKNGVALERPRGYECPDFDWADYLKQSGSEAAPDACFPDTGNTRGFAEGMWLEAVNPARPEEVCVARVGRVRGRLLWLRLEGVPQSECIVDVESMDIFPVGWCEANAYPLTPPLRPVCQKQKKIAVVQPEKQRGERPLLLLPGFREPPLLLGAVPEQGPHRGAAARRGAREMLAGAEGAAQHADQRRLQAGPRPEGAAAATGARLGQPGGNAESQVQGENVSLHRPHRAPGRADPRFLQEGLREAAVLPQPVGPRPDGRQMPRELLCPDQDQIHILLRQEEAAPQSVGRRRGQAGTSAEEEEGHLRPEEETLVELGLYRCRISSG